jgi:hypothetical protein
MTPLQAEIADCLNPDSRFLYSSPETRDVGKLLPDWCRRAA